MNGFQRDGGKEKFQQAKFAGEGKGILIINHAMKVMCIHGFFLATISYLLVLRYAAGYLLWVGSQEQGCPLISRAGIVYIVVQMISLFMRVFVGIAKAILPYTSRAFLLTVIS
ncbi:quinol oxidase [Bacillus anthracis]|uniref:quinol oxidase n=1 Tax=Bacillus anthracis TaxID=1392 RepID=UPI0012AE43E6|nr:quinol oxidase [Bacillus anthracis]MRQ20804.1 quinol oxidase [Bacillus anthracis]MRQ32568.1 quinol oxidase [Bacillus anthracis]MRQ37975.1 quinol oxidase [Bacillus anthracis]MRQ49381.1 quinol oxidase [Bacillus anthracis]MRR00405.1 quinol oxidase [Bacillus anthracis]